MFWLAIGITLFLLACVVGACKKKSMEDAVYENL